eukprot:CAMPEP_0183560858 /NCGR_PEP_ID=MMETSP0371-20130417/96053_1 /TAXON_ID=268820 /ORGANISM="Peridinium aciculiferum, Strain PAER-2" /LENGTH=36 /DNA_ID= /DNA_START= /DNA_END= /DNA_ORIENTATION=
MTTNVVPSAAPVKEAVYMTTKSLMTAADTDATGAFN